MSTFGILTAEAVRDASRRRIVAAILVLSFVSLWFVDGCTSCATGQMEVNGQQVEGAELLGWTASVLFGLLSLWTVVLAGVLASDHLTQTLGDGSATLTLARPVSRETFALSRLAGTLAISAGCGAILLGGASAFIFARYGLPLGPALAAAAGCALAALLVAALAMWASLLLPRVANFLLVFVLVGGVATINLVSAVGVELGGTFGVIDAWGPPIGSVLTTALAPWNGGTGAAGSLALLLVRLGVWAVAAVGLLAWWFRRMELSAS